MLNPGFERPGLGDGLLILVGTDKAAAEEWFQPAGMGASIRRVRLQPGYFRAPRCDRLLDAADLRLSDDKLALRALQLSLVWSRVDHKQQVVLLDRLIVDDIEPHQRSLHVRRDPDHVCADIGIVGARVSGARPRGHHRRCNAGDDDRQPDQPPENAQGQRRSAAHVQAR